MSDDADPEEVVYIASRESSSWHNDPECGHLFNANNVVEKARKHVGDREPCKVCVGSSNTAMNGRGTHAGKALLDADPEDFGLSPLGGRD